MIVFAAGEATVDPNEVRIAVFGFEPGMNLDLEVRHKDQTRKVSLKMAELPGDLPPQTLPPARSHSEAGQGQKQKVGRIELRVPEFKNEAWPCSPPSAAGN